MNTISNEQGVGMNAITPFHFESQAVRVQLDD